MAAIEFVWDSRDLNMWRGERVEKALVRALSMAGGDAARFMKSGSSRMVRSRKRFKVSRVNRALPLSFPTKKQLISDLTWRMDVSGAPVPLIDFPVRQTSRGVSIAVNTAKRTLVTSAFIATMKSGHRGVFLRELSGMQGPLTKRMAKRGMKFRVKRLPIEEAFTTRISDVFADADFIPFVQDGAQARFSSSFDRLFALELGKMKP